MTYSFEENDGNARVCFNTSGAHSSEITVTVEPTDSSDSCGTPQAFGTRLSLCNVM